MEDGCKTYSTLKSGGKGGGHGAMTKNCFGVGAFYFDRPGRGVDPKPWETPIEIFLTNAWHLESIRIAYLVSF